MRYNTDVNYHPEHVPILQSEERSHIDNLTVPEYDERLIEAKDWAEEIFSHPAAKLKNYAISLFPIATWIYRYNLQWLYGDLIAGITVGIVLVPQSMSYAQIASLSPEFGLYSSFIGVMFYCFFATSKDVSIGPVAVMSQQVGKVIDKVVNKFGTKYASANIATLLSLICGGIAMGLGLLRLGFILEFIPAPAVMGFMTGSAINIAVGQIPSLLGLSKLFNTKAETYKVIINILKHLKKCNLDAAFGLISLFVLYLWRFLCTYLPKKFPKYKKTFFYLQVLRNAVVIIVATCISWAVCRGHDKKHYPIRILKTVPSGLQHVGVMEIPDGVISAIASELPVCTIVLLLEHIAISKSFGRVNDYKINPNQELIAIGFTNLVGTFFNAYPATGSFSRSALKAKCGVRTPLAGIFTGIVVLIALYALTGAFYWITQAALSAIIIHAVGDLIVPPKKLYQTWKIYPLDAVIFFAAIIITVFVSIEAGIYFAICASCAVLLLKLAFPRGEFMGRVFVADVVDPEYTASTITDNETDSLSNSADKSKESPLSNDILTAATTTGLSRQPNLRVVWVPLSRRSINPEIKVFPPPDGVIVFRPSESFTYPNASRQVDKLFEEITIKTRRGKLKSYEKLGDRPWNDPGPRKTIELTPEELEAKDSRPILRAVVFDFTSVTSIDSTGVQYLVDSRNQINRYADREVEYHFAGILSPWTRRALINAGFGIEQASRPNHTHQEIVPVSRNIWDETITGYSNDIDSSNLEEIDDEEKQISKIHALTKSSGSEHEISSLDDNEKGYLSLYSTKTPYFHMDIPNLEG